MTTDAEGIKAVEALASRLIKESKARARRIADVFLAGVGSTVEQTIETDDDDRQCEHRDDYGLQCSELGRWHPDDQMYLCVDCRGDLGVDE